MKTAQLSLANTFGTEVPVFSSSAQDCNGLLKDVKKYLASPPEDWCQYKIFSFQSIKKALPDSCKCMDAGLLYQLKEGLTRPKINLPPGYLSFCYHETRRLFKKGWDKEYQERITIACPKISASRDTSLRSGGVLAELDQVQFLDLVERPDLTAKGAKLMVVQSAGKPRPLTCFEAKTFALQPLHKTIYGFLSKQKWLLRGEVTAEKLRDAGFKQGLGHLISGDYKSATDNLPIEVAEAIIDGMFKNSLHVPDSIWEYAFRILRPEIRLGDDVFTPSRGQMMGSFLSFPLLCIQNYLAFKWSIKGRIPLLINGDDILFQSTERNAERWIRTVAGLGLEVEESKTSIDLSYGSLNSTLLEWSGGQLVVKKTLRVGLLRTPRFPHGLGDSCEKWISSSPKGRRIEAAVSFLRAHKSYLISSRLSMIACGFKPSRMMLRAAQWAGLFKNEKRISRLGIGDMKFEDSPTCHNIVLRDFIEVPVDEIIPDLSLLNAREMAARKWSLAKDFLMNKDYEKEWWSRLISRINDHRKVKFRILLSEGELVATTRRRLSRDNKVVRVKTKRLLRDVYETFYNEQEALLFEILPPYSEFPLL